MIQTSRRVMTGQCVSLSVPRGRVLRRFGLKTGIHFAHFGLESGMVFAGAPGVYERIYRPGFIVSIPNE